MIVKRKRELANVLVVILMALVANSLPEMRASATSLAQNAPPTAAAQSTDEPRIRFDFVGATLDQVIEFFSREAGLPVVRETDVPQATFTYRTPPGETYPMTEALRILNILLQTQGVMLRISNEMLYLQKLDEMVTEDVPTFQGQVPDEVTDDQIVVTVVPLQNALAKPLAEKLATMVGAYGSVTSMDAQNSLVIAETAGKIRQFMHMIDLLDREDPEGVIEIFKVQNTRASVLMQPLKALLAEKVQKYVINQQGQQTLLEEEEIRGLAISHDDRSNSIIAKGVQAKIEQLREAIALLDVPSVNQQRMIRTFALLLMAPGEAVEKLNLLYSKLPEPDRPTIVPHENSGKVTIIGSEPAIEEGEKLLREIDGGAEDDESIRIERTVAVLPLQHAEPEALAATIRSLLNRRQQALTTLVASHDGRSLIISGLTQDVETVKSILPILDTPAKVERQIRMIRLTSADPEETVNRARELYDRQVDAEDPEHQIVVDLDQESKTATLIGSAGALDRFNAALQMLEENRAVERERRQYRLVHSKPGQVVEALSRMSERLLADETGLLSVRPEFEAIDQLNVLLVSATPGQFPVIEPLIERLDALRPDQMEFRVLSYREVDDLDALVEEAKAAYDAVANGNPEAFSVDVRADGASGRIMLTGPADALNRFAGILNQLHQTAGPAQEVRFIELKHARPGDVVTFLEGFVEQDGFRFGRAGSTRPGFVAIDRLNSVLVSAGPEQHAVIRPVIESLDRQESQAMPPLRILQLRTADAQNFAQTLMRQYDQRPADEQRQKPVTITADPNTNALVVAAHPDVLPEIESMVESLNDINRIDSEGREIRIFPLKIARAEELAQVMDEMYPEPEPLYDRRGNPIPGSKPQREVVVRADPQTNALIVDAPLARMAGFEKLVEQLDRQKLAEDTEIHTYAVLHADLGAIRSSLENLISSGTLRGVRDNRTAVSISTEPVSQTLVVSGPREMFPQIEELLAALDVKRGPSTSLRFFRLESTRADTIAPLLREILIARIDEEIPNAGANASSLLNVTTDRKTNTLIVSAPDALMPVAEELIEQLDQGGAGFADPVVRIHPLTFASAADVTANLSQALPNLISQATGDPVDVQLIPSTGSNAIILVGLETDLPQVEALVDDLDKQQDMEAMAAETFALEYTDAPTIAPILKRLLTNQQMTDPRIIAQQLRRSRGQIDLTPEIQVEAAGTNSLLVSGTRQTVDLARTLIEKLDQPDEKSGRELATYTPANADARSLTGIVRQVITATRPTGRPATLELIAEPNSGAIVLIGLPEENEQALQLLNEWDQKSLSPPQVDLKIVRIEHSDANVIAQALTPMLRDRSTWPPSLRRLIESTEAGGIQFPLPTVTADVSANRLLISAPKELLPVAMNLIGQLDQPREEGPVDLRIFTLTNAQAPEVAAALTNAMARRAESRPGEPAPSITAEQSSNSIIVAASGEQLDEIESIVQTLDEGVPVDQSQVRTIFLKHARAEHVAPIVEDLLAEEEIDLTGLPSWMRWQIMVQQQGQASGPPAIRVAADQRLNAVVVSAPRGVLDVAEELVTQLDIAATADAGERSVQVLVVENADAAELAANLEAMFADEPAIETPPLIRVDQSSNSLIVRATPAQIQMINNMVAKLDQATIGLRQEIGTITIDPARARAREVAETLKRLLDRRGGSKVEVISAEELLRERSNPPNQSGNSSTDENEEESEEKSGPISMIRPDWAALIAMSAFASVSNQEEREQQQRGQRASSPPTSVETESGRAGNPSSLDAAHHSESGATDVTIAVDDATNSIIVIGSPRAVERVRNLARQIEERVPPMPGTIRYVGLPDAVDAQTVAQLVNQTLRQLMPVGGQLAHGESPGRPGDYQNRVTVLPDISNNSIIVAANDIDFETVADLLVALTEPPATDRVVVKVYPLSRITADRAAESVRGLIGLEDDPRARRPRGRQTDRARRNLDIQLRAQGTTIDAVFDPSLISISSDEHTNSLIVMGPDEAIGFIDQFVAFIDQSAPQLDATLRLFALRHAQANDLRNPVRDILFSRYRSLDPNRRRTTIQPEVATDERTNTLLVTASPEFISDIEQVIERLDVELGDVRHPLRIVEVEHLPASTVSKILDEVVIGTDQELRKSTTIVAVDEVGRLLVRASDETNEQIDRVLTEVDRTGAEEFPVRTISLQRAAASSVAQTIQQLYDQRARLTGEGRGRRTRPTVAIVGDEVSNTLIVSAPEKEFDLIEDLVRQFDDPQANRQLEFRIFELQHAKAAEIERTVQDLVNDLVWGQGPIFWSPWGPSFGGRGRGQGQGTLAIRANDRLNALIATGEGDKFKIVEEIVAALDAPRPEGAERLVRIYRVRNVSLDVLREVIEQAARAQAGRPERFRWQPPDPNDVLIRQDERTNSLIVSASAAEHEYISRIIEQMEQAQDDADQTVTVLTVEFARATEAAEILNGFLRERAAALGHARPTATIIPSETANNIVVSANTEDLATIRDLLSRIDRLHDENRVVRIIALRKGDAENVARIVREVFGGRGGQGVEVTADVRTNSLILNAPSEHFAAAEEMIATLDSPPPPTDEMVIRTYALADAQAGEVVRLLTDLLELDFEGETSGIAVTLEELGAEPVVVEGKVIADRRSNSIVFRGTPESLPVVETLIQRFDEAEVKVPVEWRIIKLTHALAYDVSFTLRQFLRQFAVEEGQPEPKIDYNERENQLFISATPDQFRQIEELLAEIDLPKERPLTRFVQLEFANAEAVREALSFFYGPVAVYAQTPEQINTRIVANPPTNSLLISTAESEWENIQRYIEQFDNEDYDPRLQLRVIPLKFADAVSVAQAINDAFQTQVQGRGEERGRTSFRAADSDDGERRPTQPAPTVLVEAEEWVRAGAEPQTNTIIVSASRQNLKKIETIVAELDRPEYARGPAPRLIPVVHGSPTQFAQSLNEVYAQSRGTARGGGRGRGSVSIVGSDASSTIIVRAEDEEFQQIAALAEALQTEALSKGLSVHVLRLTDAPAARVEAAIREAYAAKAQQTAQPLSIKADVSANSLIIACTAALFAEIEQTVKQLDELQPAAGQGIFIIELENVDPDSAKSIIETIGLHQPQSPDSVSRLVTEPIKVATLRGRNAIIVIANPVDRDTIVGIVKAIDREGEFGEAEMRIVHLENAEAAAVGAILGEMLNANDQQSASPIAKAVQEQVRRLAVRNNNVNGNNISLDLTKPVRVIVNETSNAILVGSTPENVAALVEVIRTLDQLPISRAVVVQILPLEYIDAGEFQRIVRDLFEQGKALGNPPLTEVQGVPTSETGKALLGEIAITTDERTNTIVVAGTEEAVAFVEVMRMRLDSQQMTGWIEPRIISLTHADASDLAEMIQHILVEGNENLPQSTPLQDQIGRIRTAQGQQGLESDVFSPMTRLVVRPHEQLNALVVVGTKSNLDVIEELVGMFDIPEAAPGAMVRVYPVKHASAGRLAATIERLFAQQIQSKAIRQEDAVAIQSDERTNSLIVTTSPRSFAVLESLLKTLDSEIAPDFHEIRRIEVKSASAARLAQMIQELMDARLERLERVEPETAYLEKVSIVADPRTNSLVVAAGADAYRVVEQLARELDTATELIDGGVQILKLEHGNGERIAEIVNQIMERRYAEMPDEIRASQQPLILTDLRTNSLLVAANPEDFNSIRQLVTTLEKTEISPLVGITVIPIENKRAETLAPTLERLMEERLAGLGEARTDADRVSIEADPASNSLIVSAAPEHLQTLRGLIDALARAEAEATPGAIDIISLSRYRASDLVEIIDETYVQTENQKRGADVIRITPDDRLNALVIKAPETDVLAIRNLVERLEGEKQGIVVEIRTFPLTAADPLEVVGLLEEVLRGPGTTGRRDPSHAVIFKLITEAAAEDGVIRQQAMDEVEISTAIREAISLTPDRRTNSVIVAAPHESMELIETLVKEWDQSTENNKTLRVFTLTNADATAMAQILTDLFSTPSREVLTPIVDQPPVPGEPIEVDLEAGPAGLERTTLTTVPDERKQLSITVDSRTNSLIVAGTPWYLDLVEEVIRTLDTQEANERVQWVYPLKNATAEEVARVVGEFVEEDQRKLIETIGIEQLGSANRLLEREVTIVGDQKSNTVLVSASPRHLDRVKDMIAQLDVDPPQVLIQVLLAEVTLDRGDEWGVAFDVSRREGDVDIGAGFDLAAGALLTGMGVPNLSVAGTDFNLLIRALETQGRLQVLSNPSIMAANNEQARIQIGETIHVPVSSQVTEVGAQSEVEPQDLGVILQVTPTINPDGFVRMDINPEISELSQRTTQISEEFQAPIITVRRANTVVTVMDGQTVVLGGLISDRFEFREEAVPLLSDLPILGRLFKSTSEQRAKTELLIVLTPHVITSPAELRRSRGHTVETITLEEISRLSIPEEVKEQIRRGALEGTGGLFDAQGNPLWVPEKQTESKEKEEIEWR